MKLRVDHCPMHTHLQIHTIHKTHTTHTHTQHTHTHTDHVSHTDHVNMVYSMYIVTPGGGGGLEKMMEKKQLHAIMEIQNRVVTQSL